MNILKLSRPQLEAHLALQGWFPVPSANAALQRDRERVYVIGRVDGLTTGHYVHPTVLARGEQPWTAIKYAYLILLAERIEALK